jgi:PPM family protein phosphatase
MSADLTVICEACRTPVLPDDRFCEVCGTPVGADSEAGSDSCHGCGAAPEAIGADGYCTRCGVLRRAPGERAESDLAIAAAVTDRGRVHDRNEDAFHLELVGHGVAAVVCDGISTSVSGDLAARCAAKAAGGVLGGALHDDGRELADATAVAVTAARRAVQHVPWTARAELAVPSCTLVSATCRGGEIVLGCVGDSRAYWLADDDARQLTVDDSWATEQVADGLLSAEQAASDARAHAVTRWIGVDAPDDPPQIVTLRPNRPGRLLLCSDGLWNYAPAPAELAALVDGLPALASALVVARSLVEVALTRGGRDNITAIVVDVQPDRRSLR